MRLFVLLSFITFALSTPGQTIKKEQKNWADYARRFTGESDFVREETILSLRKIPKLEEKLRAAFFTDDRYLAFDVISTLKMRSLVPYLLTYSETDRTGYSYHALNSLLQPSDFVSVGAVYKERLLTRKSSIAARVALLDSAGRMGVVFTTKEILSLQKFTEPEVRSAALYFVRAAFNRMKRIEDWDLLRVALEDDALQLRRQALFFLSEIPNAERMKARVILYPGLQRCLQESDSLVKSLCEKLNRDIFSKGNSS